MLKDPVPAFFRRFNCETVALKIPMDMMISGLMKPLIFCIVMPQSPIILPVSFSTTAQSPKPKTRYLSPFFAIHPRTLLSSKMYG